MQSEKQMKSSYDEAVDEFDAHASQSAWNAYADRPAVLSLLPVLAGLKVLDAGCGSGLYCEALIQRGVVVYAFDASPQMVETARARYGQKAEFRFHTFDALSEHYERSYFDLVLSALVLDHIEDLEHVYAEVFSILKPGGIFLFSIIHPFRMIEQHPGGYFTQENYDAEYPNLGATIPEYRRPLEDFIRPLLKLGFDLCDLVETRPTAECKFAHPQSYERMSTRPTMMITKWKKPSRDPGTEP